MTRAAKVSLLNAALLLLFWALTHVVAERTRPTTILTYAPQLPWLLPTFGLLLLTSWRARKAKIENNRKWRLPLFNGAVLLGAIVFAMGFNVPLRSWFSGAQAATSSTRSSPNSPTKLRVMTFNIELGSKGIDNIERAIRSQNPDVICLQETLGYGVFPDPIPPLETRFPEYPHIARTNEVTTFSRFPIVSWRRFQMPAPSSRALLETVLDVRGQKFTVFNAHIAMNPADAEDKAWLDAQPRILGFGGSTKTRAIQAQVVLDAVRDTQTPFVVCGDFNIPPRGRVYRMLSRELTDSFRVAGWGCGHTFPARLPLLKIDYIWTNSQVRVLDAFVPNVRASDHRPYVADLSF